MESCFSFLYLGIGIKETFPNFLTVYCLCGFKEEASNSQEEKGNIKGLKKKLGLGITFVVCQIGTCDVRRILSNSNSKNCILQMSFVEEEASEKALSVKVTLFVLVSSGLLISFTHCVHRERLKESDID